jgi:hypothetical protein
MAGGVKPRRHRITLKNSTAIVLKRVLAFTGRSTMELLFYSLAQVLDEMKSIGALAGLRRALVGTPSIEAASVSGHDLDLRMIPKPASRGSSRSVLKDIDDLAPFEVDNNCSVVVSLSGGPIVDAHHANGMAYSTSSRPPLQMTRDRVGATGDAHHPKQPLARQATDRMAGRVDQCLDPVSDPREWPCNAIKSFGEGYVLTAPIQTSEPSDSRIEDHPCGLHRQILNPTIGRCCGR